MMINIGDDVRFRCNYLPLGMIVIGKRRMFASNLYAYTVKYPHGEVAEYDETQLVKVNNQQCNNCHDMVLYPDEGCPDCGRQA